MEEEGGDGNQPYRRNRISFKDRLDLEGYPRPKKIFGH